MKKLNAKAIIGISCALIAGLTSFISNIQEQKKDDRINDMDDRIKKLESKESD